jgi:sarcosine oxidase
LNPDQIPFAFRGILFPFSPEAISMGIPHYDAIVVGLGGVGTFALRALAKEVRQGGKKRRFLGIEQGSVLSSSQLTGNVEVNEAGHSSRGLSRIYRRAYFEHANYVPWIEHSLTVFREMEQVNRVSLMKECGMLLVEPSASKRAAAINLGNVDTSQLPPYVSSSHYSAKLHDVPVEFLNSMQLKQRFPQFHIPNRPEMEMVGLLEPGGGFLRPEQIMNIALQEATCSESVVVKDQTKVTNVYDFSDRGIVELCLQPKNGGQEMKVTTNKLLISMGARTSTILPMWKHFLHPVRQVQGWIDTHQTCGVLCSSYSSEQMPAFVYISPDFPEALYGVPCDDADHDGADLAIRDEDTHSTEHRHWLKVGIHKQNISPEFDFDAHSPQATSSEKEELQQVVPLCIETRAWPIQETVSLTYTKPCLYTMTPDKHFVLGAASPNIFGVAGLSGHGFKMTPALGQMMADFAMGKDNLDSFWQAEFCAPRRFD